MENIERGIKMKIVLLIFFYWSLCKIASKKEPKKGEQ